MKTGALPKQVDLRGLAARGSNIVGTLSPGSAPRLTAAGVALAQPAEVAFEFYRDDASRYVVDLQVTAAVVVRCQRCLNDMTLPLKALAHMACVWSDEEAAALADAYEPLLVSEEADLNDIAEEEILLALPACPVHEQDCKSEEQLAALAVGDEAAVSEAAEVPERNQDNPFQILERLKN
jgi:uncharacterized protein